MVAALAGAAHGATAEAATTLRMEPAAGPPGTKVALAGAGFARRASVVVSVHGNRSVRVRTDRHGRFAATTTIRGNGRLKLSARGGGRRVRSYLVGGGATRTGALVSASGARITWTPRTATAGTLVALRGSRLRRTRVTVAFPPSHSLRRRTGRKGTFSGRLAVPQLAAGRHSFTIRAGGLHARIPYLVQPDPVIAGAGDIACGANSGSAQCRQMVTSNLLLQIAPTAVLALGDTQYENGEYSNYLNFYDPSWGRLKAITHPVVGNHEYGNSDPATCGYACGYFDYFDGPGQMNGRAGERGAGYYAFDVGAWRLYAMNSNCTRRGAPGCGEGSAQLRWLRDDLASHPRRCSLMFMHHPLFTSDTREFDGAAFQDKLRPLWQAFYAAGGDVVMTGHSHFYERYAPQDPYEHRDPAHGIRQFIVGTGGRNVYSAGTIEPTSEVRGEKTFGVLRLDLHAASYDWRFIPEPGKTFTDAGSQACH